MKKYWKKMVEERSLWKNVNKKLIHWMYSDFKYMSNSFIPRFVRVFDIIMDWLD